MEIAVQIEDGTGRTMRIRGDFFGANNTNEDVLIESDGERDDTHILNDSLTITDNRAATDGIQVKTATEFYNH